MSNAEREKGGAAFSTDHLPQRTVSFRLRNELLKTC